MHQRLLSSFCVRLSVLFSPLWTLGNGCIDGAGIFTASIWENVKGVGLLSTVCKV